MRIERVCLFIAAVLVSAWCCISPTNLEGVAFTSGETLKLDNLTKLGTENVNYFKDTSDTNVGIRYVSQYDNRAMVFVGTYGMSYQKNFPLNCMGVFFPTDSPYQRIDTATFCFAKAVRNELEWLAEQKVVSLSAATIGVIDSALLKSSNGGVQYWTHAGTVLGYNSWYSYDTLNGVWGGTDGVRGVNGVYGCSLIKPGTNLPTQPLGSSGIQVARRYEVKNNIIEMTIRHVNKQGIIVNLSRPLETVTELTVLNCRGEIVLKKTLSGGIFSQSISFNTPGYYSAEITTSKLISRTFFIIVK